MGTNFAADLLHVLAFLNGADDGGVGGRPANAALFQFLHQRRLVEARRRLGKVLLGLQALQRQLLARDQQRQLVLERLVFFVLGVLGLLVDLEEAFELQDRTGHAEAVAGVARLRLGIDVDGRLVEDGRVHLRGDKALPDELVDLVLVFLEVLLHRIRMARHRGRTNRLVRLLRRFSRLVGVRRLGQKFLAEVFADQLAHLRQRVVGNLGRVGTHVGDESDRAFFAAQIDAFIQALRDHHGALDAEAQLARGVLLELAGGEGRSRTAPALARIDRADAPVGALQRGS